MSTRLRVEILTPEAIVAAGVRALLHRHPDKFELPGEPTAAELRNLDVVLYDALFVLDGTAHLERVLTQTTARVLVMDRGLRPGLGAQASQLGAHGSFSLGVDEEQLVAAVLSAGTGWRAGDPGSDPTVGAGDSALHARRVGSALGVTARELEILTLITQGYNNREIAALSYLSVNSIKTYIRTGYRRIGVRSRSEAVRWGIEHGLSGHRVESGERNLAEVALARGSSPAPDQ